MKKNNMFPLYGLIVAECQGIEDLLYGRGLTIALDRLLKDVHMSFNRKKSEYEGVLDINYSVSGKVIAIIRDNKQVCRYAITRKPVIREGEQNFYLIAPY